MEVPRALPVGLHEGLFEKKYYSSNPIWQELFLRFLQTNLNVTLKRRLGNGFNPGTEKGS
jgi:hypothetical protein